MKLKNKGKFQPFFYYAKPTKRRNHTNTNSISSPREIKKYEIRPGYKKMSITENSGKFDFDNSFTHQTRKYQDPSRFVF